MRTAVLKGFSLGLITGSFVTAGAVLLATPAKADTSYAGAVCATLDDYPSLDGVFGVGVGLHELGYTYRQAGQIIADAVVSTCPEYVPLLKAFAARYGGAEQKVA